MGGFADLDIAQKKILAAKDGKLCHCSECQKDVIVEDPKEPVCPHCRIHLGKKFDEQLKKDRVRWREERQR